MKNWVNIRAGDFVEFNPRLTIKKGAMATKIAMDKLQPFTKKIPVVEQEEFIQKNENKKKKKEVISVG